MTPNDAAGYQRGYQLILSNREDHFAINEVELGANAS
jgi:hypothetical protein